MKRSTIGALLLTAAVTAGGVLSLYGTSASGAPQPNIPPFANTTGRQLDIIQELKEVVAQLKKQNQLLTEQNNLLKSGKLQVVVKIDEKTGR